MDYLVEPGIVKDVEAPFVDDRRARSFRTREVSRSFDRRRSLLEAFDEERGEPKLRRELRHFHRREAQISAIERERTGGGNGAMGVKKG